MVKRVNADLKPILGSLSNLSSPVPVAAIAVDCPCLVKYNSIWPLKKANFVTF